MQVRRSTCTSYIERATFTARSLQPDGFAGVTLTPMRARHHTAVLAVACLSVCFVVHAQPSSDQTRRLARDADQRIRELQVQADRLAAQTKTLLGDLRALELQREIKAEQLRKANADLAQVAADVTHTAARLAALEAQRVADTPGVKE